MQPTSLSHVESLLGLQDPWSLICAEVEHVVVREVPGATVDRIVLRDRPMFVAFGRTQLTHSGVCMRALVSLRVGGRKRHAVDATLTILFELGRPGHETTRTYFDLHAGAETSFSRDVFEARFLAYCRGTS